MARARCVDKALGIDEVGDLIATLGSARFGSTYFELFDDVLSFDQCTVFAFRKGAAPPAPLIAEGRSSEMREMAQFLAAEYVAGGFVQDPSIPRTRRCGRAPTVHYLHAEQLADPLYRMQFYEAPRLSHELIVLGQAEDVLYYSSFYRTHARSAFEPSELQFASRMAGFAVKALHRHFELLGGLQIAPVRLQPPSAMSAAALAGPVPGEALTGAQKRRRTFAHLRSVLLFEPCKLSPREADVCASIILGCNTRAIGLEFDISANTVHTHRKRAYRKLGIASQSELFGRYFQLIGQYQAEQLRAGSGAPVHQRANGSTPTD